MRVPATKTQKSKYRGEQEPREVKKSSESPASLSYAHIMKSPGNTAALSFIMKVLVFRAWGAATSGETANSENKSSIALQHFRE